MSDVVSNCRRAGCALFVPTVEGLLGDKLTAFGPNTTGVALNEKCTMQFT